ncbi:DUF3325 domain-containing protein [Sphingobium yanoikuyae]|nr:hypothetical protein BV87_25230 [Sphingobium yanoikuyae]
MTALLPFIPAVLGMSLLALSMPKHYHDQVGKQPSGVTPLAFRIAGWLLTVISLASAIAIQGRAIGPILWLGLLTVAAQVVALILTCRVRWRQI